MSEQCRPWNGLIGQDELEVYRRAGYFGPGGFGRRPALLVVDVEYNFTGDRPEPILDSIAKFRNSCGEYAWATIPQIRRLLEAARACGLPVVYTHGLPMERPATPDEAKMGREIVAELAPQPGEAVIAKGAASAFFGTDLVSHLVRAGVDTVLVSGCTTSGCVRATAVDSCSFGFRTIVVEECVFDRAITPHCLNLFDMAAKYADVRHLDEVLDHLHAR